MGVFVCLGVWFGGVFGWVVFFVVWVGFLFWVVVWVLVASFFVLVRLDSSFAGVSGCAFD